MEKNRNSKIIAIIALIVAVVGLSLGFAAFSSVLTISSSAEVVPENNFKVVFSREAGQEDTGDLEATQPEDGNGATGDSATLADTTISGLKAHFTKPGQKIEYNFHAYNAGAYKAYLKKIEFVDGKTCETKTKVENSLVTAACADISVKISVKGEAAVSATQDSITFHELDKGASETIKVTIEYAAGDNVADEDFDVTFGDIKLTYSSTDTSA